MGTDHRLCDEFVGLVNTGDGKISITHIHAPQGWEGPAHYADFHQYILVLRGQLSVEHSGGILEIAAGQAADIAPREAVILSASEEGGCEYVSVCTPAYSRANVHMVR
jgi:quercetin dioxygenase-like cupin family protein